MIIKPTREESLKRGDGKYYILICTAKRERQIAQGSPKLTNAKMESDVTTAAIEIAEDKVIIKK